MGKVLHARHRHLGNRQQAISERMPLDPVRTARIHYPRFVPRVGLRSKEIRTLSAPRLSRGWVRKDLNLRMRIGCTKPNGYLVFFLPAVLGNA